RAAVMVLLTEPISKAESAPMRPASAGYPHWKVRDTRVFPTTATAMPAPGRSPSRRWRTTLARVVSSIACAGMAALAAMARERAAASFMEAVLAAGEHIIGACRGAVWRCDGGRTRADEPPRARRGRAQSRS